MTFSRLICAGLTYLAISCGAAFSAGPMETALGAIEAGKFAKARKILEPLALEGDAAAASTLAGVFFSQGSDLHDPKAGLYWLKRAAKGGHSASANSLGLVYLNGTAGQQDVSEALTWFRRGAAGGEVESAYFAGRILLETAAEPAQAREGMALLKQAVDKDFPPAYHLLGSLYEKGHAVQLDTDVAAAWYEKAAKAGFRPSISPLTNLLMSGQVSNGRLSEARRWLGLVAKGDDAAALYRSGILALHGIGGEADRQAARAYFDRAAHLWDRDAQYQLGLIYLQDGTPEAVDLAYKWFDLSANAGHDLAHLMRTWAGEQMDKDRIADARRAAQVWFDENHATPHEHHDLKPHAH